MDKLKDFAVRVGPLVCELFDDMDLIRSSLDYVGECSDPKEREKAIIKDLDWFSLRVESLFKGACAAAGFDINSNNFGVRDWRKGSARAWVNVPGGVLRFDMTGVYLDRGLYSRQEKLFDWFEHRHIQSMARAWS